MTYGALKSAKLCMCKIDIELCIAVGEQFICIIILH